MCSWDKWALVTQTQKNNKVRREDPSVGFEAVVCELHNKTKPSNEKKVTRIRCIPRKNSIQHSTSGQP